MRGHGKPDIGSSALAPGSATASRTASAAERWRFEGFTLDLASRTLSDASGKEVPLWRSEFALLTAFLRAPGRVLSREQLLDAVSGRRAEAFDRSIDVLVGRLRRKIEPDPKAPRLIKTVPGVGYKFTARPHVAPASAADAATRGAGSGRGPVGAPSGAAPPDGSALRDHLRRRAGRHAGSGGLARYRRSLSCLLLRGR